MTMDSDSSVQSVHWTGFVTGGNVGSEAVADGVGFKLRKGHGFSVVVAEIDYTEPSTGWPTFDFRNMPHLLR